MTFAPGGTLFGDGYTSSMTGKVMYCQAVLCILWAPFIFCPSIAVIIIPCIFTGKTLEAVWKWCRVKRRPHVIEVDVLGKHPVFREDKSLDHSYSEGVTEEQHSDPRCGEVEHSYTLNFLFTSSFTSCYSHPRTPAPPRSPGLRAPARVSALRSQSAQSALAAGA